MLLIWKSWKLKAIKQNVSVMVFYLLDKKIKHVGCTLKAQARFITRSQSRLKGVEGRYRFLS